VLKLKSKDILVVAFKLKKPVAKKPLISRVGDVVITDGYVLLSISILCLAIICCSR
jgi:hypothetical protein